MADILEKRVERRTVLPVGLSCEKQTRNEETVRIATVLRKLLGVTSLLVKAVMFEAKGMVVNVRPRWRNPRCSRCGKVCTAYDRCPPRKWRHLAYGRLLLWLRYAPLRVDCPRCGIHVEQVPWASPSSRFTSEFEELVAYYAQQMAKTAVAKLLGIDWRTVGAIVERLISERLDPKRLDDLTVIGVDELSFRRRHNYVTVVVDHLRKRVVWVGEGKSGDTLRAFFDALGPERTAKLTHVTMDLSSAFIAAVDERAPQAEKVFDRFHVQRLASDAVDEVRRDEVRRLANRNTGEATALKQSRWALLKKPWNLELREESKLAEVQQTNKRLYRAYLLKESLASGLDYRQPARAERHLDNWMSWARRSRLRPFVRVAKTIQRFKQGVLAYVRTRLTNGLVEGLNNKTRLITRRAFGFHSARALMAMIHLCCGGITLAPPLPVPT
jgi:transposase